MLYKLIEWIRSLFKRDVLDTMLDNFNYDAELRLKEERLKQIHKQAGSDPMKQIDYIIENGFEKFNDLVYGDVEEKKENTYGNNFEMYKDRLEVGSERDRLNKIMKINEMYEQRINKDSRKLDNYEDFSLPSKSKTFQDIFDHIENEEVCSGKEEFIMSLETANAFHSTLKNTGYNAEDLRNAVSYMGNTKGSIEDKQAKGTPLKDIYCQFNDELDLFTLEDPYVNMDLASILFEEAVNYVGDVFEIGLLDISKNSTNLKHTLLQIEIDILIIAMLSLHLEREVRSDYDPLKTLPLFETMQVLRNQFMYKKELYIENMKSRNVTVLRGGLNNRIVARYL